MTQVLARLTGSQGGGRVVSTPLMFQATLFLLLLPSFLVGGLAILGPQGMLVQGVWGLVLGPFRGLVSRVPSAQGERLVSRVPERRKRRARLEDPR